MTWFDCTVNLGNLEAWNGEPLMGYGLKSDFDSFPILLFFEVNLCIKCFVSPNLFVSQ